MPLPVAHSLMGYTLSEVTQVRLAKKTWLNVFIFVTLANLPDLDFLPGYLMGEPNRYHHLLAHSLTLALGVGFVGALIYRRRRRKSTSPNHAYEGDDGFRFWPYFLTISLVVFSHCFLDLLTVDTSPPYGMVLFWPFDMRHYDIGFDIFQSIQKSNDSATFFSSLFQWYNFKIALWELLIMSPIVGLVKIAQQLRRLLNRPRAVNIEKTQVAKLGLLKVSSTPPRLSGKRSMASVSTEAEEDEQYE